jgi:TRAP-type mannitol/chloroaromatic compound transport system substrate-binding protein
MAKAFSTRGVEMLKLKYVAAFAAALALMASPAMAAKKVLRIQSVLPTSADEVVMLKEFGKDVAALTNGSLTIEVLPAGAVVGPRDIIDAVDAGLVEGGFAWTHYWGGKHVAANLFGAPVAGAGVGLDNMAFLSWFQYGGGKEMTACGMKWA